MKSRDIQKNTILKNNVVFKSDVTENKDKIIRRWIELGLLTEGNDELELKRENINTLGNDFSFQNIMIKTSSIIIVIFLVYLMFNLPSLSNYFNTYDQSDKMLGGLLGFMSLINGIVLNTILVIFYLILILLLLYFSFIKVRKHRFLDFRQKILRNPEHVRTLKTSKRVIRITSEKYLSDLDLILNSIDFEATIANFRNLPKESGIIITLAKVDDEDIALCYL